VKQTQNVGILGAADVRADGVEESLAEVDLLTVEGVLRTGADELEHGGRIVRIGDLRSGGGQRRVDAGEGAAVHMRVRQEPLVEQVHCAHALGAALLHDLALEELRHAALELECAAYGIAEGRYTAAMREVIPEGIPVDAIAGLRKEARISLCLVLSLSEGGCRRREAGQQQQPGGKQRGATPG